MLAAFMVMIQRRDEHKKEKQFLLTPHGFDYLKILVLKEKNREEWLSAMLPVPNLSLYSNQDV